MLLKASTLVIMRGVAAETFCPGVMGPESSSSSEVRSVIKADDSVASANAYRDVPGAERSEGSIVLRVELLVRREADSVMLYIGDLLCP